MSDVKDLHIPADVPAEAQKTYAENFELVTQGTGRLMLFAGDQKVEHLNSDFYGEGIASDDADPIHLFNIASKGKIGAFASQLGLISRYGNDFPKIPYIIKVNSKSNLVKTSQADPYSSAWYSIANLLDFRKKSGLNIVGFGYTVYIGSEYEEKMLKEAAGLIYAAHEHGLLTVIWMYPRGKAITDEKDPHLIAGAAGVAATLGTDFAKVNYPKKEGVNRAESLKEAVMAAGRTRVICAGGESEDAKTFLQTLHDQINIAGTGGNATGRNIHQKPLDEAVRFCNAIAAITFEDKSPEEAYSIYTG